MGVEQEQARNREGDESRKYTTETSPDQSAKQSIQRTKGQIDPSCKIDQLTHFHHYYLTDNLLKSINV